MKLILNLSIIALLSTSCGKVRELMGTDEELDKIKKDSERELDRDYPCRDFQGQYTNGQETIFIINDCKFSTITCGQKGNITNLNGNNFNLTLPQSIYDDACFHGNNVPCSYALNGAQLTITCQGNTFNYTKR